jgi:hypothetical protein
VVRLVCRRVAVGGHPGDDGAGIVGTVAAARPAASAAHLFWDPKTRTWVEASKLKKGEHLKTDNGQNATADGGHTQPTAGARSQWKRPQLTRVRTGPIPGWTKMALSNSGGKGQAARRAW